MSNINEASGSLESGKNTDMLVLALQQIDNVEDLIASEFKGGNPWSARFKSRIAVVMAGLELDGEKKLGKEKTAIAVRRVKAILAEVEKKEKENPNHELRGEFNEEQIQELLSEFRSLRNLITSA